MAPLPDVDETLIGVGLGKGGQSLATGRALKRQVLDGLGNDDGNEGVAHGC